MSSNCIGSYGQEALRFAKTFRDKEAIIYSGGEEGCKAYSNLLNKVNFAIEAAFSFVSIETREIPDIEDAAKCWEAYRELCDEVMTILQKLHESQPECAESNDWDLILDTRTEATKRAAFLRE